MKNAISIQKMAKFHVRVVYDPCMKKYHFWPEIPIFHARVACDPCLKMTILPHFGPKSGLAQILVKMYQKWLIFGSVKMTKNAST